MVKTIELSAKGLMYAQKVDTAEMFTFLVGEKIYKIPKLIAAFIAPKLANILTADPTQTMYKVKTADNSNMFELIMSLSRGEQIEVNDSNFLFILSVALELQNRELVKLSSSFDTAQLNPDNAIRRLREKLFLKLEPKKEADYIASRFCTLDKDILIDLETEALEAIISSPKLQIVTETQLLNFVFEAATHEIKHAKLVGYVLCEYLPACDMAKYIQIAELAGLEGRVWDALRRRLLADVKINHEEAKNRYIDFEKGDETKTIPFTKEAFGGIIKSLSIASNDNPHTRGDIEISASSSDFGALSNLFENNGTFFGTKNDKDSWIQFDFKNRRISLSAYSIRGLGGVKFHTIRSWKLVGSNDKKEWTEIDTEWDIDALNGKYHAATFPVRPQSQPFRYFRIMQAGPNWAGSQYYNLAFSQIDFFGDIIE